MISTDVDALRAITDPVTRATKVHKAVARCQERITEVAIMRGKSVENRKAVAERPSTPAMRRAFKVYDSLPTLTPEKRDLRLRQLVGEAHDLQLQVLELSSLLSDAVAELRHSEGMTWTAIGELLGVTRARAMQLARPTIFRPKADSP